MSTYLNSKSNRSYTFVAPLSYEGENIVKVPFPVATTSEVKEGAVSHNSNPSMVYVEPSTAETINVERDVKIQPGNLLIVKNTGTASATFDGIECEDGKTTTLMFDGNSYIKLGETANE